MDDPLKVKRFSLTNFSLTTTHMMLENFYFARNVVITSFLIFTEKLYAFSNVPLQHKTSYESFVGK